MNDDGWTILKPQVHETRLDEESGHVIGGYRVTIVDSVTNTRIPLFVPEDKYSADNVKAMADHAVAQVRAVHELGQQ